MTLQPILAPALAVAGVSHGFFTRQGGALEGVYATLNGGIGSRDDRAAVLENRRRMAETLGVAPERFLVPYQVHSAAGRSGVRALRRNIPAALRRPGDARSRAWRSA